MLDGELRQEVGKGERGVTSGLQEGGGREVRAMRWNRVFTP